jgi:hypothetical protein
LNCFSAAESEPFTNAGIWIQYNHSRLKREPFRDAVTVGAGDCERDPPDCEYSFVTVPAVVVIVVEATGPPEGTADIVATLAVAVGVKGEVTEVEASDGTGAAAGGDGDCICGGGGTNGASGDGSGSGRGSNDGAFGIIVMECTGTCGPGVTDVDAVAAKCELRFGVKTSSNGAGVTALDFDSSNFLLSNSGNGRGGGNAWCNGCTTSVCGGMTCLTTASGSGV